MTPGIMPLSRLDTESYAFCELTFPLHRQWDRP